MKDALYLETDEEITSAIDKMAKFEGDSVSIVVPKRSSLLQSIVNLRLLKKAAEDAGKELVLVTTDKTTTHLAAKAGLAVASSLKAAPVIPEVGAPEPDDGGEIVESAEADSSDLPEEAAAPAQTKGKSNKPSFAKPMLVRTPVGPPDETPAASKKSAKVPNFNKLQKRMLIGGGVLALLILGWTLNFFLKTATVTLYARATRVAAAFDFTVDPGIKESDFDKAVLAGQKLEVNKDLSSNVAATGKKDVGTKATGTITIKNCDDTSSHPFPAGSVVTAQGKNFKTNEAVTIPVGTFGSGLVCTSPTVDVGVTAAENGDSYNLAPTNYTSPSLNSNYRITGGQMSGGTSRQVTIVSQEDIEKAKEELMKKEQEKAKEELEGRAATGYMVIPESFFEEARNVTSNPAVGAETSTVTVTVSAAYSQLAVNKAEYEKLVEVQELAKIGAQNQIYDNGTSAAKLTPAQREPSGRQAFNFSAEAYAGPKIDTKAIAKNIAGKRYGEAAEEASRVPGVERADVDISPGWNSRLPRLSGKIKVEIKVAE